MHLSIKASENYPEFANLLYCVTQDVYETLVYDYSLDAVNILHSVVVELHQRKHMPEAKYIKSIKALNKIRLDIRPPKARKPRMIMPPHIPYTANERRLIGILRQRYIKAKKLEDEGMGDYINAYLFKWEKEFPLKNKVEIMDLPEYKWLFSPYSERHQRVLWELLD